MQLPYFVQVDADGLASLWPSQTKPKFDDVAFVKHLIERAENGDAAAGAELLRYVRSGIDARLIVATAPEYEVLLPYLANALTAYVDSGVKIERALGVEEIRPSGQPTGANNPLKVQFAALMLLMMRRLGCSADTAQERILEVFERADPTGNSGSPFNKRTLQQIYADHKPMRELAEDPDDPDRREDLLRSFITYPRLRKLFPEFLAKT